MRPLSEEETKTFFEKLAKYIGRNIKFLIDRPDEPHCFRLHNDRVYYIRFSFFSFPLSLRKRVKISLAVKLS